MRSAALIDARSWRRSGPHLASEERQKRPSKLYRIDIGLLGFGAAEGPNKKVIPEFRPLVPRTLQGNVAP